MVIGEVMGQKTVLRIGRLDSEDIVVSLLCMVQLAYYTLNPFFMLKSKQ